MWEAFPVDLSTTRNDPVRFTGESVTMPYIDYQSLYEDSRNSKSCTMFDKNYNFAIFIIYQE